MKKTALTLALLIAAAAVPAGAQTTIAEWNLTPLVGNEVSVAGSGYDHVSATVLSRGSGLSVNAGTGSFNSAGWSVDGTVDYVQFGFTVEDGYQVDLANLAMGSRSSNTGPGSIGVFTSMDGFTTSAYTLTQSGTSNLNSVIDLSSLDPIVGSFAVRLMLLNPTAANGGSIGASGTFRVTDYFVDGVESSNLGFTGTVTAIPEPSTYAALAGLLTFGFAAWRRRSRA